MVTLQETEVRGSAGLTVNFVPVTAGACFRSTTGRRFGMELPGGKIRGWRTGGVKARQQSIAGGDGSDGLNSAHHD
jgi:hypothetical protein